MKKVAILLSTLVLLAGCSQAPAATNAAKDGNTATTVAAKDAKTPEAEAKSITAEMNKPVTFKNYEITVTKVEKITDELKKDAVKITYNYKNLGDKEISATTANNFKVMQGAKELKVAVAKDKNAANNSVRAKKGEEIKDCVALYSLEGTEDLEITITPFVKSNEKAVLKTALPK